MMFPRMLFENATASSNPSFELNETAHKAITAINAKNIATPVTRWRIDEIAEGGNLMVLRSKFTGLCFFTMYAIGFSKNFCFHAFICLGFYQTNIDVF